MFRPSVLLAGPLVMTGMLLLDAGAQEEKSEAPPAQSTSKPKAKKVYTNEDLKTLKDTTRVNQSPATMPSDQRSGTRATGMESYRDKQGHDRDYWQKKLRPLNNQLETLDTQIAAQQAKYDRLNAASGVKLSRSGTLRASSSDTRIQAAKRIDDLKQKRAEVLKSKQDLEEEGRKAQALPEWLR